MKKGLIVIFVISLFLCFEGMIPSSIANAQRITVTVVNKDGVVKKGMGVRVTAIIHKYGENIKKKATRRNVTNAEGKVTLVFDKNDKWYFDGEAEISTGSGIFSPNERQRTRLGGIRETYYFRRESK